MINPEELIQAIRDSFSGSVLVYTRGSCYQFYRILKEVFPQAEAYYDSDHVITKIGDKFYDITGEVECKGHLKMSIHYPESKVKECKFSIYNAVAECPECDHIFYFITNKPSPE